MKPDILRTLPIDEIDWPLHLSCVETVKAAFKRFDKRLNGPAEPRVLISLLALHDAVISSRIEGIRGSFKEALIFEANPEHAGCKDNREDIQKIINYRKAFLEGISDTGKGARRATMVWYIDRILQLNIRGAMYKSGTTKGSLPAGTTADTPPGGLKFTPPANIREAMENWDQYYQGRELSPIIQLAVVKAQFELIHPFPEGTGRIGRMLVPLFLWDKTVISSPLFFFSSFQERHQEEYQRRLLAVREENDWDGWISFFLDALLEQAVDNSKKVAVINRLYDTFRCDNPLLGLNIPEVIRTQYFKPAIDTLFSRPLFNATTFFSESGIPRMSAERILRTLAHEKVIELVKERGRKKSDIYRFPRLIRTMNRGSRQRVHP